MKKMIKMTICCLCSLCLLAACDDAEEGLVKVTHYVTFALNGADENNNTAVPVGSEYVEPGCVAMEGDKDVTASVLISGDVDTSQPGVCYVNYSAQNVDGFASSVTRTVSVYDPSATTRDISGTYTVAEGSYRLNIANNTKLPYSGQTVNVVYYAPGLYFISDYLGGFYDQRAGYGSSYAITGFFMLNNDNSIDALNADVAGWGDSANEVKASYDEATGCVLLEVTYAEVLVFYITLTK